jgi:hypothetical protein
MPNRLLLRRLMGLDLRNNLDGKFPMANPEDEVATTAERRKFLASCGRFAVVTPPAITMLLSTSLNSTAIAHSGGWETTAGEMVAVTEALMAKMIGTGKAALSTRLSPERPSHRWSFHSLPPPPES